MVLSTSLCKAPTFLMRLLRKCRSVRPVTGLCAVSPESLDFLVGSSSSFISSRCGSGCRYEGDVERGELVSLVLWDDVGVCTSSSMGEFELLIVGVLAGT